VRAVWWVIALGSLAASCVASPTVTISAAVNGTALPTGATVSSGTRVDYTVTVANPDAPKTLTLTATVKWSDAGTQRETSASSTVSVVSVVRPVITLAVPSTLTVDTASVATSGRWPEQTATLADGLLTWRGGDLAGGSTARLAFGGVVR